MAQQKKVIKGIFIVFLFLGFGAFVSGAVLLYYCSTPGDVVPLEVRNETNQTINICLFNSIMKGQVYLPFSEYRKDYKSLTKGEKKKLAWKFSINPTGEQKIAAFERIVPEVVLIKLATDEIFVMALNENSGVKVNKDGTYQITISDQSVLKKCPEWLKQAWKDGIAIDESKRPKDR